MSFVTHHAEASAWRSFRARPPLADSVAMLATDQEIAMWQDRSVSGPFRVAGDFSPNSPGHWTEMSATMSLDFSAARWTGPTRIGSAGQVLKSDEIVPGSNPARQVGTENDPPGGIKTMAHDMMSAAYAAITTGNTTVAQAITAEIEWQASQPNLDFSNRTLYPFGYFADLNPLFMMAVWVKDYILAYDITKAMGYPSATVEQWFLDLSELCEQQVHADLSIRFPDRKSGSYTVRDSTVNNDLWDVHRLADGTIVKLPFIVVIYNNRRNNMAGLYGLVGALLDNTYYIAEFKRFMREWVMFGNRLGTYGSLGDAHRGTNVFPQLGYSYATHAMEACMPAMEGLARKGDTDLYDYSSSDGSTQATWGTQGFKTMEDCIDGQLKWVARTWPLQYTGDGRPPASSVAGNPYYLVSSRNTYLTREIVGDAHFLHAANYYNRPDWYDIIMRVGTPTTFTSIPHGVGNISGWRADWRNRFLRSLDANPHGGA